MTEFTKAKLAELRAVAEAATPGPWRQWNPSTGPSHVTIGGMVAFESLQSATPFGDDEVIPHWADAYHIATFDPPTVLALIAALESKTAEVCFWQSRWNREDGYRIDSDRRAGRAEEQLQATERRLAAARERRDRAEARADRAEAALERVREAATEVTNQGNNRVRTHYDNCWKQHLHCLAAKIIHETGADDE